MASNRDLVNPKRRKGKEVKSRALDLMGKIDNINEGDNKASNVEFVKKGPDGDIYGIVRENKNYFIKKAEVDNGLLNENKNPVVRESDFNYIGGLANKNHKYGSYAEALKQMNLKFGNISESIGSENPAKNSFVSDDIIVAEDDEPVEEPEKAASQDEEDEENVLYDNNDELSEAEKHLDEVKKNGGEKPIKENKEKKDKGRFGILRLLEDDEMDYNDFMMKMARKHFGAKTDEELGQALKGASDEERQDFFADLDKWTGDREEKYMGESKKKVAEEEQKNNPYAICHAQANEEGGWSDEKIERCVKDVKKQNESKKHSKGPVNEMKPKGREVESSFTTGIRLPGADDIVDAEIEYHYRPGYYGDRWQPDDPEELEILDVYVNGKEIDPSKIENYDEVEEKAMEDAKEKERGEREREEMEREEKRKEQFKEESLYEEEEDEDIEDRRYVLRTPGDEGEEDPVDELSPDDSEEEVPELGGDEEGSDVPFDDTEFDAGVEADEEQDPRRYIQQLSGKLATTLRNYRKEEGEDLDLEQFAINTVLSATNPHKLGDEEQQEMINRIQTGEGGDEEGVEDEESAEEPQKEPSEEPEGEGGEEDVEDIDGEEEVKKDEEEGEDIPDFQ